MKNTPELTIVLGYSAGDAPAAERLLDWCFELNNKKPINNTIVLLAAANVHAEMQTKVKLAAEVAFTNVETFLAGGNPEAQKVEGANHLFNVAATIMQRGFRRPWLWIEPDCVPLSHNWITAIAEAYDAQPKRYFGPHCKFMVKDQEKISLGRVACYPPDALNDVNGYCMVPDVPFSQLAAEVLVVRSSKCRLIQHVIISRNEDLANIRADAVLLHSDKSGISIEQMRSVRAQAGKKTKASTSRQTVET